MSVIGVIASLSTATADGGYTVTRRTNAGFDPATGDALPGVTSTFPIDAVIMSRSPSNYRARSALGLIEGRHTEALITIYTATELLTGHAARVADRLVYRGEVFEVVRLDGPFHLGGGTHYEVIAARMVAP